MIIDAFRAARRRQRQDEEFRRGRRSQEQVGGDVAT
jgi:hypothetical protein